ncbi:hypothetical protein F4811DRAFT_522090 [Daldinia bambusicola]|nr:hypothetical protein F4811DRAFT_522090 [Daldinia bambusicola]
MARHTAGKPKAWVETEKCYSYKPESLQKKRDEKTELMLLKQERKDKQIQLQAYYTGESDDDFVDDTESEQECEEQEETYPSEYNLPPLKRKNPHTKDKNRQSGSDRNVVPKLILMKPGSNRKESDLSKPVECRDPSLTG